MNKTVLITGANGGIGRSLTRKFKHAKWDVIGLDISENSDKFCDLFFKADVSKIEDVITAMASIKNSFAGIDCIINNAAIQVEKTLLDTTEEEWKKIFSVNVHSIYYITKYFINLLKKKASIINISSVHARATAYGLSAYAASKGAVSALTRAMAIELASLGVRVNTILPGAIQTSMLDKNIDRKENPKKVKERLIATTPLKKIGDPKDVANLALFLADHSSAGNITGQEFICDGGVLARLASE